VLCFPHHPNTRRVLGGKRKHGSRYPWPVVQEIIRTTERERLDTVMKGRIEILGCWRPVSKSSHMTARDQM
jgi:hypothetical protein